MPQLHPGKRKNEKQKAEEKVRRQSADWIHRRFSRTRPFWAHWGSGVNSLCSISIAIGSSNAGVDMERETETGRGAQCSTLLCPHSRRSEADTNPSTPQPHPRVACEFPPPTLGFLLFELSIWHQNHSLTLWKGAFFFVSLSVLKSSCLLPCDLSCSLAEWVFEDGKDWEKEVLPHFQDHP